MIKQGLYQAFEKALQFAMNDRPDLEKKLQEIAPCRVLVKINDAPLSLALHFLEDQVQVLEPDDDAYDLEVSARAFEWLTMAWSSGENKGRSVHFIGDVAQAKRVQAFLMSLSIDWEDKLAPYIGGVPAYQLGRAFRFLHQVKEDVKANVFESTKVYIENDSTTVVTQAEAKSLYRSIHQLQLSVDRLELIVARKAQGK